MTTDPNAAPEPVLPDEELITRLLDQLELKYVVDEDGDLGVHWDHFRTYFMIRGTEDQRTLAVRTFYDRRHGIEAKPHLLETIDDWNRRTLWPKVYSHTADDGAVTLIGEALMLIGTGVTLDHFVASIVSWIRASVEFDDWLREHHHLPAGLDSGTNEPDDDA